MAVLIRFLGTNGWYTTDTGKTTCILIDAPDVQILLDAGEGISNFREYAIPEKPTFLFFSHAHLDHIYGLHMMGMFGHLKTGGLNQELKIKNLFIGCQPEFRKMVETIFNRPFTAPFSTMDFSVDIRELPELKTQNFKGFKITPYLLEHAVPNYGYKIEAHGKKIFYSGDTGVCGKTIQGAKNADILIHECTFPSGIASNWGHVNPEQAAEIAKKANVKKLVLVHFDAYHYKTLEMRRKAEKTARKIFPNTTAATDGLLLEIQ